MVHYQAHHKEVDSTDHTHTHCTHCTHTHATHTHTHTCTYTHIYIFKHIRYIVYCLEALVIFWLLGGAGLVITRMKLLIKAFYMLSKYHVGSDQA